ncbi:CUB and sushi domain-containing protein 3-like [Haliotis rubra]|uniref:CUB and sushi domain-containing protein 3-like n=1 Tax=Haliotis rubra TaxID=36100 RepID=UPI001EE576E3|nr:CUB and sushi domain-containing protein 3-like [Haliotis rubra]
MELLVLMIYLMMVEYFYVINACGGTWASFRGTMTSPGYPYAYPSGPTCWYYVTPPSTGQKIQLKYDLMVISYYDTLEVKNSSQVVVSRQTGKRGYSVDPASTSYVASLTRKSPYVHTGFKASWVECGGDWTSDSGTFSSPYYPNHYHKLAHCIYTITPTSGSVILLTINTLSLADNDVIKVTDGDGKSLANLTVSAAFHQFGPSSSFRAEFKADYGATSTGFHATWQTMPPSIKYDLALHTSGCAVGMKFSEVSTAGLKGRSVSIQKVSASVECLYACLVSPECSHYSFSGDMCTLLMLDGTGYPLPPTVMKKVMKVLFMYKKTGTVTL